MPIDMPRHDIPDRDERDSNLIDFRDYLNRRVGPATQDRREPERETSDRDAYRYAEYGDGKRPKFSRFDLIWVAMIVALGWIVWTVYTSRG
ncbi:hypothetical protein DMC47_32995 [Nostoc sp. 3335mG]|nr:hypothetical protein DMC47_32995 [Nostoc sp. 3335mG]